MYDGNKSFSWFSETPEQLFDQLLQRKYKGYQIYAHRFDIIFIFKYLSTLKNMQIKVLMKDNNIININITNRNKGISINIKDSYLILPSSLAKLSQQFNIQTPKLTEPVLIDNPNSKYQMQDLSHYSKDIEQISDFNLWKSKVQNYCEVDCISLYQVITKFRNLIILKF